MTDRYSFVCNAGCGVCGVKLVPFEYSRTETLEGELLDSKVRPQIVSTCCRHSVGVYDNVADTWLDDEVELSSPATPAQAQPEPKGTTLDEKSPVKSPAEGSQEDEPVALVDTRNNDLRAHWTDRSEAAKLEHGTPLYLRPSRAAAPVEGAATDAQDAARYRWLRDRLPWTLMSAHGYTRMAARLPVSIKADMDEAHEMDAALDAAMASGLSAIDQALAAAPKEKP